MFLDSRPFIFSRPSCAAAATRGGGTGGGRQGLCSSTGGAVATCSAGPPSTPAPRAAAEAVDSPAASSQRLAAPHLTPSFLPFARCPRPHRHSPPHTTPKQEGSKHQAPCRGTRTTPRRQSTAHRPAQRRTGAPGAGTPPRRQGPGGPAEERRAVRQEGNGGVKAMAWQQRWSKGCSQGRLQQPPKSAGRRRWPHEASRQVGAASCPVPPWRQSTWHSSGPWCCPLTLEAKYWKPGTMEDSV